MTTTNGLLPEPWNIASWVDQANVLMEGEDVVQLRDFYRAVLAHYPTSVVLWYCWMQYEYRRGNYEELERLFAEALRPHGDVRMWRLYLQYVRTCNPLVEGEEADAAQLKRQTILKAFDLALAQVGLDMHSISIYRAYIDFARSWKTQSLYEQQLQMDQIRKIYQKALATPLDGIEALWHEYDAYENGLSKLTAKKVLADRSAAYMSARAAAKELKELVLPLDREEYALPPPADAALGAYKCSQWLRWIEWEKSNPLLIPDKATLLHQRTLFAYRCCLAVLRHYPEIWFNYSRYLVSVSKGEDAEAALKSAVEVLPADLLVNFAYCDLLEGSDVEGKPIEARAVYEALVEALQARLNPPEAGGLAGAQPVSPTTTLPARESPAPTATLVTSTSTNTTIATALTLALTQYMNFSRRVEGINAARAIFTRARKLPHISHHIFLAAAKMEYFCKRDSVVAGKIFELGMSRFAASGEYVLEYLQHLIQSNDEQNARALFERSVLSVPPGAVAMEIWKVYLDHVFRYGDMASIRLLSRRFQEAYPDQVISEQASIFLRQYSYEDASPSGERVWALLHGSYPATVATAKKTPKPFNISDLILDLCDRLPASALYDGPRINYDGIIRLLQIVRLPSDPAPPLAPSLSSSFYPTTSASASASSVSKPGSNISGTSSSSSKAARPNGSRSNPQPAGGSRPSRSGRTKRRRYRLDDGDQRTEPTNAPIREDDIFARRFREREGKK